jgi:hypothetical protein
MQTHAEARNVIVVVVVCLFAAIFQGCRGLRFPAINSLKPHNAKTINTGMARVSPVETDPFMDPAAAGEEPDDLDGITLPVGKNASLTLATDSLVVLGIFPSLLTASAGV